MSNTLVRDQVAERLGLRHIDATLTELYEYLIGMSWEQGRTFEEFQAAWVGVEEACKVEDFDYSAGERPVSVLGTEM